jgi:AcrR family transcriptional regulator
MKPSDPVRERLLSAAQECFARHGYDSVSVRQLTTMAKANLGAITYHFGSKEALYHEAFERLSEPFAAIISGAAASHGTGLERVEAVVRAALSHSPAGPGAIACLLRELAGDRPLPPPMLALMKRNVGTMIGLITAGQADGSIRAGDPMLLAISAVSQPFYFKIAGRGIEQALGVRRSDPAAWQRVIDHVAMSVRQTLAKHPRGE